jgi:hypothetical protein
VDKPIETGADMFRLLDSVVRDSLSGHIRPAQGNVAINGCGKMLKLTELTLRYGTPRNGRKVLALAEAASSDVPQDPQDSLAE